MKYVALLRGINVGSAKSVPMAELALVFCELGFNGVKTLLRSGNVVFESDQALPANAASVIETAVLDAIGVQSSVIVVESESFTAVADANPLAGSVTDGSKSFVTFLSKPTAGSGTTIEEPDAAGLFPELLRLGDGVIYQWIPDGSLKTRVPKSFWKQFAPPLTTRNWNTVMKLARLLD